MNNWTNDIFNLNDKFQMFIKFLGHKTHTLETNSYSHIKNIRIFISNKYNIPTKYISLIFKNKLLHDDEILYKVNIVKNSTILAFINNCTYEKYFQIFVKYKNKTFSFNINENIFVEHFKKIISKQFKLPINSFYFNFSSQILYKNKTMKQYNVEKNSTLFLNVK